MYHKTKSYGILCKEEALSFQMYGLIPYKEGYVN